MAEIINGKAIAEKIELECKEEIIKLGKLGIKPKLAIVIYNPDESSRVYVDLKIKKAQDIGLDCKVYDWSEKSAEACIESMHKLAEDKSINGIIMQLPANGLGNVEEILKIIPNSKDVDGLSGGKSYALTPATPKAILEILDASGTKLKGKKIAIIGQGKLVGKPLTQILQQDGYSVVTADSSTKNLEEVTKDADIVVSAVGKPNLIVGSMIKPKAVVLDAGTSEQNGSLVGDVDYNSVEEIASKIAKVPGGVGPVTVVSLLKNVIEATKNSQ